MSLYKMTVLDNAGVTPDDGISKVLSLRANVFEMTQAAEDAVLRPVDFGAFGHDLRAALAARVAQLGGDNTLAEHYRSDAGKYAALADPEEVSAHGLNAVLNFVDKVANQTRESSADDILRLQAAEISDADIVRLCGLVAFLAFQIRVTAGLSLMHGGAA